MIRGVHRFEGRSSFKTWLFKILVNRARTAGNRDRRQVPVDPTLVGADASPRRASTRAARGRTRRRRSPSSSSSHLDDAPVAEAIHAAVRDLPEPQQAVVTLRDVQGLSTYEVSALLGLTEGNVRVILHRGRAKVREALEGLVRGGGR